MYYKFLVKYEPDFTIRLSSEQEKVIEFISCKIANGKRIHEVELLDLMLKGKANLMKKLQNNLEVDYSIYMNDLVTNNVMSFHAT